MKKKREQGPGYGNRAGSCVSKLEKSHFQITTSLESATCLYTRKRPQEIYGHHLASLASRRQWQHVLVRHGQYHCIAWTEKSRTMSSPSHPLGPSGIGNWKKVLAVIQEPYLELFLGWSNDVNHSRFVLGRGREAEAVHWPGSLDPEDLTIITLVFYFVLVSTLPVPRL